MWLLTQSGDHLINSRKFSSYRVKAKENKFCVCAFQENSSLPLYLAEYDTREEARLCLHNLASRLNNYKEE